MSKLKCASVIKTDVSADVSIWPLSSHIQTGSSNPSIAVATNVSTWLYCPNNTTFIRLFVNSSADRWPQRSDLKDKSDFPAVWTVCVAAKRWSAGWMCVHSVYCCCLHVNVLWMQMMLVISKLASTEFFHSSPGLERWTSHECTACTRKRHLL